MNSQVSGQCLYTILWPIFLVYYIFVSNAFLFMVINGILFYVEFNQIRSLRFLFLDKCLHIHVSFIIVNVKWVSVSII